MPETEISFFARVGLAFAAFFRTLGDAAFAAGVRRLRGGAVTALRSAPAESALQLLGLLQREARLLDFVDEDIAGYADAQVGAAARVVHEGCRRVIREHVKLAPVRGEQEGATLQVDAGYDAAELRLVGNLVGAPPYRGVLRHRGWRADDLKLPLLAEGHDVRVIAPAEVEL
ncbi:MAG: DUF2760 domain-containing protein [Acidobacteria bacterium]|nr:DUF2760 domain-containing protein [Acidobacteriota bacterium]